MNEFSHVLLLSSLYIISSPKGPSGSGKTSLMNVLSGRAAYQEGSITINGKALNKAGMKKLMSRVAYVKQQDIFFETLSVRD
jgi:ABC-type multidrug transport system ATPase subunit